MTADPNCSFSFSYINRLKTSDLKHYYLIPSSSSSSLTSVQSIGVIDLPMSLGSSTMEAEESQSVVTEMDFFSLEKSRTESEPESVKNLNHENEDLTLDVSIYPAYCLKFVCNFLLGSFDCYIWKFCFKNCFFFNSFTSCGRKLIHEF